MSHISIIGAGISGLSVAQLLKDKNSITIFEANDRPGGLIRCEDIDGSIFHTTGGHVFNTKYQEVLDWFWSFFDKDKEFVKADRNAAIVIDSDHIIGYPIENHVYQLSDEILKSFIRDLIDPAMSQKQEGKDGNFADFLLDRFGNTLYQLYFEPYNQKVWRRDLHNVPLSWLEGKLPMPTKEEMVYNNIRQVKEKKFVHSSFYYPRHGGSQFIADRLAKGLDIRYNSPVTEIQRDGDKWIVNGEPFDRVIYTGNIKELPNILKGDIDISGYASALEVLEYHGTTSVFCEIDPNPYSWIYLPNADYEAHRIICTGNFSPGNNHSDRLTATVEFTDYISQEDIEANLAKMPFAPTYITHNYVKYTYPIQDSGTRQLISDIKSHLAPLNFDLLGRFAEWEYCNMDVAIKSAISLAKRDNG